MFSLVRLAFLPVCLLATACGGGSISPPVVLVPPTPGERFNLTPGPHIGYIVGFDLLDGQQNAQAQDRFSAAVAAGMSISRVQLGWSELELQPGEFELGELMLALDRATVSGQQAFFTLTTLDTGELTIPSDLMAADLLTPAPGLNLDGPEIAARFQALLDWLVPELESYGVWGLALANEPSTLFESIEQQQVTRFLTQGADYANVKMTWIAITVTIAGAADDDSDKQRFIADLMPHLNLASFNYYCLGSDTLQTTSETRWQADMETFIARAQGREVFFQELGCPAGWGDLGGSIAPPPTTINATPELQADFFRFMMNQIESRDALRAATIFQLNDWSPELARSFADSFRFVGEDLTADRLEEWLATIGMCRWSDGTCRAAFDIFLDGAARMASVRTGQ